MKKVSLLILLVLVLSTVMMAAIPTKMVRLTIINKSDPQTGGGDFAVYMKLTGSAVTDAFYYLTVPSGSKDAPTVRVFTVMQDVYSRETWQCGGLRSAGTLVVDGNIRLTFTPCGQFACQWTTRHLELWGCGNNAPNNPLQLVEVFTTHRYAGEPRMEKVTYFQYLVYGPIFGVGANNLYLYGGFWNFGCFTFAWRIRSYRLPLGCAFRYQY